MNKIFIFISFTLLFSSCRKDETIPTQPKGWEYAGMQVGRVIEYESHYIYLADTSENYHKRIVLSDDSLTFLYQIGFDTIKTYIKDSVAYKIEDVESDSVFVTHRYYSTDRNYKETPDSVWTGKLVNGVFVKTENNTKYVKMSFPVENGKEWDVDVYNSLTYPNPNIKGVHQYKNLRLEKNIDNLVFDNTVSVETTYNDYDSTELESIFHRYNDGVPTYDYLYQSKEVYAENVGLINKTKMFLENLQIKNDNDEMVYASHDYFIVNREVSYILEQKIIDYR